MTYFMKRTALLIALALTVGCNQREKKPHGDHAKNGSDKSDLKDEKHGAPGHSHQRGKMLLVDAGKYHALLTAHLSPKGNELDIFIESADEKNPIPVALPMDSFTAQVNRTGEDEVRELKFESAPPDERPKDEKPGTCSHFVAKAPWIKSTDSLTVVVRLQIDGESRRIAWENFNPKKYAHHEE